MSLDKAVSHNKEKRKAYRGAKAIDPTCRNHGSCDYCRLGRLYKYERQTPIYDEDWEFDVWETEES